MRVKFWGTRGSIPSPGRRTLRYGGNTLCVEVRTDGGQLVILDCGTGLRELGYALMSGPEPVAATILISHTHWDHTQGFAFFAPATRPDNQFTIYAASIVDKGLLEVFSQQMDYLNFPVSLEERPASMVFRELGEEMFNLDGIQVATQYMNHTILTLGYRLTAGGVAVVVAPQASPWRFAGPDWEGSVLGTAFSVVVQDRTSRLAVAEGRVTVVRGDERVAIAAGERVRIAAGAPLAAVPRALVLRWAATAPGRDLAAGGLAPQGGVPVADVAGRAAFVLGERGLEAPGDDPLPARFHLRIVFRTDAAVGAALPYPVLLGRERFADQRGWMLTGWERRADGTREPQLLWRRWTAAGCEELLIPLPFSADVWRTLTLDHDGRTLRATVDGQEVELLPTEVDIQLVEKEGYSVAEEGGYLVAVATALGEALRREGLAREVVRRIQVMRKDADFRIEEPIVTYFEAGPELRSVLEEWADYIRQETLSRRLVEGAPPADAFVEQHRVDGQEVTLGIVQAVQPAS